MSPPLHSLPLTDIYVYFDTTRHQIPDPWGWHLGSREWRFVGETRVNWSVLSFMFSYLGPWTDTGSPTHGDTIRFSTSSIFPRGFQITLSGSGSSKTALRDCMELPPTLITIVNLNISSSFLTFEDLREVSQCVNSLDLYLKYFFFRYQTTVIYFVIVWFISKYNSLIWSPGKKERSFYSY